MARHTVEAVERAGQDHIVQETQVVLRAINDAERRAFRLIRRLPGGFQEGAYEIRDGDERLVLKWHTKPTSIERLRETARTVDVVRRAGWPTPAWHLVGITPTGARYSVMDFVDGDHPDVLTPAVLEELLSANEVQRGLAPAADQEWSQYAREVVFDDRGQMFSSVTNSCDAGRDLERAIHAACAGGEGISIPADDLVCGVFALENILFRDGRVAGVIDVGAIGRGCRAFDLSVLYARVRAGEGAVEQRLRTAAERVAGPLVFRVCLAAEVIGVLSFGVKHWPANLPTACATWARRFTALAAG